MTRDSSFFSIGESLGISWFRLYLADSLASRFPVVHQDLARWLILHLAVQSGGGHIRTGLSHLEQEMAQWYSPTAADAGRPEYEPGLPGILAAALPVILKAAGDCRVLGSLKNNDDRADDLPVPRPPLVLSSDGQWVYFLKRRREEDTFLDALSRRAAAGSTDPGPEPQDAAALIARKITGGRKLVLLAGGPGTGKTTTVARLLGLLASADRQENRRLEIALAAPTGRAAARLAESLSRNGNTAPALRGRTIHSLLGIAPGRPARYNPENPLPAELVIVDEASMVDLPLMNRLLAAMSDNAALVLVGDPDQLPSVEAGALLGDLLRGDVRAAREGRHGPLHGAVVTLSRVFRSDTAILDASSAIRDGDFESLEKQLRDEAVPAAGLRSPGTPESMARIIADSYMESFAAAAGAAAGPGMDEGLKAPSDRSPVTAFLTPLRRGPWGVPAMNERVSFLIGGSARAFPGMPVMITGNDRQRNLWNGDRGMVVSRGNRLRVVLDGQDGEREFPLAVLPGWEPAWLQTIHKSQGSEFDKVSVLLPPGSSGITTRELLYTAFTRARHKVTLYADPDTVRDALDRQVRRHSRIQDWAAG